MIKLLMGLAGVLALFSLYVRLAPSPASLWHRSVHDIAEPSEKSYRTTLQGIDFLHLHDLILQTDRTKVLAGSPEERHVTYITRSALWNFPDYTTIEQSGSETTIVGRSRFGKKDLGVNQARIQGWVADLIQTGG
ncbi:DUF1499 domain-containing protein [Falsihalocynthiibacter sp. S25ZX9]|uniref:DUF1499 domain-containing protein n=1 Tax=Falsihalocynthiibacter sp. S25ZX9 TaxID=3240870 RepID=UPI00351051EB